MRAPRAIEVVVAVAVASVIGAVASRKRTTVTAPPMAVDAAPDTQTADASDASVEGSPSPEARGFTVDDDDLVDPPEGTTTDREKLLALVPLSIRDQASTERALEQLGPYTNHGNQGNPEISTHAISRAQCKEQLKGVVLQTAMQRKICGGQWEVPIHNGDPTKATTCIDQFEYPNHPCVLPFVFTYSILATRLCKLQGKRLCTQEEWSQACESDPNGGPPSKYAYGDTLDLSVCNTGKEKSPKCDVDKGLWKTCPSDTVPSGSYPKCKSRLGVYDQHGNVAEAMTRKEGNVNYVQLKGSAWFYDGKMYADDCRFDPRWHVDPVDESWHTNYHLGFRCCRSIEPLETRGDAGVDAAPILPKPQAPSPEDPYADDDAG